MTKDCPNCSSLERLILIGGLCSSCSNGPRVRFFFSNSPKSIYSRNKSWVKSGQLIGLARSRSVFSPVEVKRLLVVGSYLMLGGWHLGSEYKGTINSSKWTLSWAQSETVGQAHQGVSSENLQIQFQSRHLLQMTSIQSNILVFYTVIGGEVLTPFTLYSLLNSLCHIILPWVMLLYLITVHDISHL